MGAPSPRRQTGGKRSRAGNGIGLLGLIWAEDRAHILGAGGKMLWHVPADFKHFKDTTLGWPIIMGRASFEALGGPLKGRRNIVLTRSGNVASTQSESEVETAESLSQALLLCAGTEQVWITGGGQVYREVMEKDLADLLVVTELDLRAHPGEGDEVTYAPTIDPKRWELDTTRSDTTWRPISGDARWKVLYYQPR